MDNCDLLMTPLPLGVFHIGNGRTKFIIISYSAFPTFTYNQLKLIVINSTNSYEFSNPMVIWITYQDWKLAGVVSPGPS